MTNTTVLSDGYNSPRASSNSIDIYQSKNFNSEKTNSLQGLLSNSPDRKGAKGEELNNTADHYDPVIEERSQVSFDSQDDVTPVRIPTAVMEKDDNDEEKGATQVRSAANVINKENPEVSKMNSN